VVAQRDLRARLHRGAIGGSRSSMGDASTRREQAIYLPGSITTRNDSGARMMRADGLAASRSLGVLGRSFAGMRRRSARPVGRLRVLCHCIASGRRATQHGGIRRRGRKNSIFAPLSRGDWLCRMRGESNGRS